MSDNRDYEQTPLARFPCTLCGSRNWPRPNAGCQLCELEDDDTGEEE